MVTFRLVVWTGSTRERTQGSPEVSLKWERPRDTAKTRAEALDALRRALEANIPQGYSSTLAHRQGECPRAYLTVHQRSGVLVELATYAGSVTHSYPLRHPRYGQGCAGTWTDRATGEVLVVGQPGDSTINPLNAR